MQTLNSRAVHVVGIRSAPALLLECQIMERSESRQGRSKIRKARQRLKAAECKRILKSNLDECRVALQREKKVCELLSRYA